MGVLNKQNQSGKSDQSGTSSQTNTYDWMKAPDNPYYDNAASLIGGYDGGAGAARAAANRNVNDIKNAGNDMFGATTPDYARDKVRQSRLFSNNLALGQQLSDAKQNETAYKNNAYMSLGAATAPTLVQTGSNGTYNGSSDYSGSLTPGLLNTVGQIGGIAGA